jgi:hypothetical protein
MTVKKECVVAHLKHDFKELGKSIFWFILISVGICVSVFVVLYAGSWLFNPATQILSALVSISTADNVTMFLAFSWVIGFILIRSMCSTKKSMVMGETVEDTSNGVTSNTKVTRPVRYDDDLSAAFCIPALLVVFRMFFSMLFGWALCPPLLPFAILGILIIVFVPIANAIALCREEETPEGKK